jgi:hypothetical protein
MITFQGCCDGTVFPDTCLQATSIYEDCPDNSSGQGKYLAVGRYQGQERRIFIRFNFSGIWQDECRNPNLGFMAPFDSVWIVFYVVPDVPGVVCDSIKERRFFLAAATESWDVGANGEDLDSLQTLLCGESEKGGPTWASSSESYKWPYDNQPRNLPFPQDKSCIDSIVFVCHRPMPYNSPMKRTIRDWIMHSAPNPDNFGWVMMADSTQKDIDNSALVLYSPTYPKKALRPKLILWFPKGVDRRDNVGTCGTIQYLPVKKTEAQATDPKKK